MEKVIIFSAPSGSGKTTLVKYCLEKFPQLEFSITATTRALRGTEIHGKDYFFITEEDFRQRIENQDFVEFEEVYPGKFYGTLKSEIERISSLKKVVIFDVDVKGGISLKKYFGEKALSIFIMPPNIEELEQRLISRGTDDLPTIKLRVEKAAEELTYRNQFDKIIVNDSLENAKNEISEAISEFLNS